MLPDVVIVMRNRFGDRRFAGSRDAIQPEDLPVTERIPFGPQGAPCGKRFFFEQDMN